jgi:hypothetical protein
MQAVSQNVAGPEDDLQEINASPVVTVMVKRKKISRMVIDLKVKQK